MQGTNNMKKDIVYFISGAHYTEILHVSIFIFIGID